VSAAIYRYDVRDGAAVWDLTEFDATGGVVLQELFETMEAVLARPDVEAAVVVFDEGGGISRWFFERLDRIVERADELGLRRVAFGGPPQKQLARRSRFRGTDVAVLTPQSTRTAIEWAV
jgi:hypothetical protein